MTKSLRNAWLWGAGILLAANMAELVCSRMEAPAAVAGLWPWLPAAAAFVTAWRAPAFKALLGGSMCLPAAAMTAVANLAAQVRGARVDFPGVRGELTLVAVSFAWTLVLCLSVAGAVQIVSGNRRSR